MTRKTKVIVWVGAILGTFAIAMLSSVIAIAVYTENTAAKRQRQQEKAINTLKQGLTQDLQDLSKMQIKPMSEDDYKKWTSGVSSPTATPQNESK